MPDLEAKIAGELKWSHIGDGAVNRDYDRFSFSSRRSVVWSAKGVTASTQPAASQAGLEILQKGGNAADAAVAVAAALAVTEPVNCGMGGDCFALFWDDKNKQMRAINGSGRAPQNVTLEKLRQAGIHQKETPMMSVHSVTVPGAAAGFEDTIKNFGSGKLTLAQVLEPAIRLAEEGFPVEELTSYLWKKSEDKILKQSPNGKELLCSNGKAPEVGQIFTNKNLAKTLRALGEHGKKGYYEGRIAEAIVDVCKSKDGFMELSDLSSHVSELIDPISYTYKNSFTLHECPPNGQGLTPLIAMGILEQMQELGLVDLGKAEHNGVEYSHAIIEALRLAFADTRAYIADMQHVDVPIEALLNKDYLRKRAKLFNPKQATADVRRGTPLASSDTVYLTTSDADGNACSFIFSNYAGVGTGIVPKGCGFTLQNRGAGFTLEEGHANNIKGGKRPYHTIIPAMVTRAGAGQDGKDELFMAFGVMGGFMQPQGHTQVMLSMLHKGFNPQNALDAPRLCISAGPPTESYANPQRADGSEPLNDVDKAAAMSEISSEVFFEDGYDPDVVKKLAEMGHQVGSMKGVGQMMFGRGQIIQRVTDSVSGRKVWAAGSDPRGDGHALCQI